MEIGLVKKDGALVCYNLISILYQAQGATFGCITLEEVTSRKALLEKPEKYKVMLLASQEAAAIGSLVVDI